LHRRFSEMELAKQLNSLTLIQENPELAEYFEWVAKQKIQVG
jgi:hypothetical protein